MPARVEAHDARIALQLECAFDAAWWAEPQRRHDAHAEPAERGIDGERRSIGGDRVLEEDVHQRLVPHERRVGRERRPGDVGEGGVEGGERPVRWQRDLRRDEPRRSQAAAAFVDRDAVRDPERRGVADGGFGACEVEIDLVARRKEDVAHRGYRRAHEETQPLALGAEEGVNGHVVRDLVRAQARREPGTSAAQASATHTTRTITGARPRGSIRQSFTIARSVYWRPIRGNSPRSGWHS